MNPTKKTRIVVAGLLLTFICVMAACSTSQQTTGTTTTTMQAQAELAHAPSGTSDLAWTASSQTLTVKISLSGLAPKSTHPAHIHKGDCTGNGAVVFPLNPVQADSTGVGTSETTITGDAKAIPDGTWYINVHNGGDGLTPALQDTPIACGNIANPNASTTSDQSVHLTLSATPSPNQSVSGNAKLTLDGTKLTVKLTLSGLVPYSTHIAHIHKGSCQSQGAVAYPLTSVVADANGNGTSTTTIDQIDSLPTSGWYVNVHQGGSMSDLSTQTGDDPISCGNVELG